MKVSITILMLALQYETIELIVFQALSEVNHTAPGTYEILAVTRNLGSSSAIFLSRLEGVRLVLYERSEPEKLFSENKGLWGVFSVQSAFQEDEIGEGESECLLQS